MQGLWVHVWVDCVSAPCEVFSGYLAPPFVELDAGAHMPSEALVVRSKLPPLGDGRDDSAVCGPLNRGIPDAVVVLFVRTGRYAQFWCADGQTDSLQSCYKFAGLFGRHHHRVGWCRRSRYDDLDLNFLFDFDFFLDLDDLLDFDNHRFFHDPRDFDGFRPSTRDCEHRDRSADCHQQCCDRLALVY